MASLADLRKEFPDLAGLSDNDAVDVIHSTFYADLPRDDVANALGVKPPPPAPPAPRTWGGVASDVGISALKGVMGVPAAAVGLADLATGGRAGKAAEAVGVRFKEANDFLDTQYTPQQRLAFQKVQQAEGFGDTLMAALENPSVIGHTIVQSVPSIAAGGVVGRGALAVAPKLSPVVAGAIGEGAVSAGGSAEQVRQETPDGLLTAPQAAVLAGSGALTGVLGVAGGTLAQRLGITDVDTLLTRAAANKGVARGITQRVLRGAVAEGVLEELPQSVQEQVAQNVALKRPIDTGVDQAAVLGMLSGAAMGGGVNAFHAPPAGPLTRAAQSAPPAAAPAGGDAAPGLDGMETGQPGTAPPTGQEPQDPVIARINQLQGADRSEALAAYGILNHPEAGKGARQYNQKLLDELLAKLNPPEDPAAHAAEASDPAALLASTMGRDPVQGALAERRDEATAQQNLDNWMARAAPLPLDHAQELQAAGAERGLSLEVVPHNAGQGFTVVPAEWMTPAMRNQTGAMLPLDTAPTGVLRADAAGNVKPETGAQAIDTRQALAAKQAEEKRLADLGLTPDVLAVQAGKKRPPLPTAQPGDITVKTGKPFGMKAAAIKAQAKAGAGEVLRVQGGWVVRGAKPQEAENVSNSTPVGAVAAAGSEQPGGESGGSVRDPGAARAGDGAGVGDLATAPASGSQQDQPVRKGGGEQAAAVDGAPSTGIRFMRADDGGKAVPTAQLRKRAMAWAEKELIGKSYKNADTGADILVTRQGLKHGLSNANEVEVQVVGQLPELLQSARLGQTEPDSRKRPDVKAIHRYQGAARVNEEDLAVGIVVREMLDGHRYYDHFALKKQTPAGQTREAGDPASRPNAGAAPPDGASGAASDHRGSGSEKVGDQPASGDGEIVPPFKRGDAPQTEAARQVGIQQFMDAITEKWSNPPEVIVVRNMADTLVPEAAPKEDAAQKSQGGKGEPQGFFYEGKVYIVADGIKDPLAALTVLAHEALGHYGLRGMFGDRLKPILQQIVAMRPREVAAKARSYGMAPRELAADAKPAEVLRAMTAANRLRAAEEVLAKMAQDTPALGFVRRAVAAIKTWLREHVPGFQDMALTNDEIIRSFILPARGWVVRGRESGVQVAGETMFSRAESDGATGEQRKLFADAADTIGNLTLESIHRRAGNTMAHYRNLALATLGRRQLVEIYGKDIPQLQAYSKLVQQMDADKNEAGAAADELAVRWGKLKDERQLAELMHDATLAQIDPAKDLVEGDDAKTHANLQRKYNALSDDAKKVYTEARDLYEEHYAQVREAIRARIERSELASEAKARILERMDGDFFEKIRGVYFPLARFGQYLVVVKDGAGKAVNVSRAETLNEADALRAALAKEYAAGDGFTVGKVLKAAEFNAARDGVGRGFMQELTALFDQKGVPEDLQDSVNQLYLSSLPDLSWAKHGIHRKGMPGFSQDARRAFANSMFHGARYLAKLRYADRLQAELTAAEDHVKRREDEAGYDSVAAQDVLNEMNKRHENLMNPKVSAVSTALTSFGYVFHMGLSPASAIVNLMGTPLVAYPMMAAKWGYTEAGAQLLRASRELAAGRNDLGRVLKGEEKTAFDEAVRRGTIDVTMAHDLAGISQGEDAKVSWKMRPVMKAASFMFHHAEKFNRQATFMAAYRLARAQGQSHAQAYDAAEDMTFRTHFDYAASNRPRFMQGNVARVVFLFKQYSQNMVYLLTRQAQQALKGLTPAERAEARKALAGLLVMHAAAAGVLGLPLVSALLAAASFIGGSDDEPWDAETALRNMLADAFGQKPAEVLARGLSRLTPWDISGRVGLDKLILPDVQEGLEGEKWYQAAAVGVLGPVAGIGLNAAKGMGEIGQGHWARGMETMMPAVVRQGMKAARYYREGAVDKTGVPLVEDVSAAGIGGQALGFAPADVRLATEAKSAIYQQDQRLQHRRQALVRMYAQAVMAGDKEGAADVRQDIDAFNKAQPERRIKPAQLQQSVRARRKRIDESQGGVFLSKNRRGAADAGRFATQED